MATHGKRRALGQHFLRDPNIINRIAETALEECTKTNCRALLEVGPGKGAITLPILERLPKIELIKEFVICERDRKLADEWKTKALSLEMPLSISIEESDFLDLNEDRWLRTTPLGVVSNLPYSAGTAIVTRLARHADKIPFMVLMFQAEVAQRLRAEPSTKDWGSLSVWIQNRWDVRKLIAVPPGAFSPPPEVQSEVVVLTRREVPRVDVPLTGPAQDEWESLLKACFAHRRKMLRSGLAPGKYRNALEASGVDGTKRAEALTWEEWEKLYRNL